MILSVDRKKEKTKNSDWYWSQKKMIRYWYWYVSSHINYNCMQLNVLPLVVSCDRNERENTFHLVVIRRESRTVHTNLNGWHIDVTGVIVNLTLALFRFCFRCAFYRFCFESAFVSMCVFVLNYHVFVWMTNDTGVWLINNNSNSGSNRKKWK